MQVDGLKIDKLQGAKGQKQEMLAYFLTNIFAGTKWKLEWFCKIKDIVLSFRINDFLKR